MSRVRLRVGDMRAVERLSWVAAKKRSPNSSIPRARTSAASAASADRRRSASAISRSVAHSSSSTGRAAPRRIRIGSAGSTTAATTSATTPPTSASSVRANEIPPVGGVMVNTSAAEIATWLTNSALVPKNMPSPTAMNTASASCGVPVPSWNASRSATMTPSVTANTSSVARRPRS